MESNLGTAIALPLALFVIMFALGISLRMTDFRRVFRMPKAAMTGLSVQLVFLPIAGYAIARAFALPPELAVGLMVLAACPGGATSNLITWFAKGDTALSVTLTAVSSFVSVLTIPLIISFALWSFMGEAELVHPPLLETIGQVVIVTVIPISLGMFTLHKAPGFAERQARTFKIVSVVLFVVILAALIASQRENIVPFFLASGPAALALNLVTLAIGFGLATYLALPWAQRVSVSIEGGLQNGTLAIAITASPAILNNPQMAIPAAIYSLLMFGTGILAIYLFPRLAPKNP